MQIEKLVTSKIISLLLKGEDYRVEVLSLIDSSFFEFMDEFLANVAEAKATIGENSPNWYELVFLNDKLPKDQIAINSGLNMKTISNMFNSSTKEIVKYASKSHFESLREALDEIAGGSQEFGCTLNWHAGSKNGNFSLAETYLIINTLAVKRAAIRGGAWSTIGKRVEKPLMLSLCEIFSVPKDNFDLRLKSGESSDADFSREIDFFLRRETSNFSQFKCEVKLMGHGNPESADAVIARDSQIFVADKLSDSNKKQLDSLDVKWVELRSKNGFMRFGEVLKELGIPHEFPDAKLLRNLDGLVLEVLGLN